MSLSRPSAVRDLLVKLDFRPSRVLGQNFLIDGNLRNLILDTAEIQPEDTVVEVGPGLGVITEGLLERAAKLIAIEKDDRLAAHLQDYFADHPKLTLHHTDATTVDYGSLQFDRFVSNLPYSVGSRILFELFHEDILPERIVVTVQREVADRLISAPNCKEYGLLSIVAQMQYEVERVRILKPSCFFPPPQIDSALVLFKKRAAPRVDVKDWNAWRSLVKRCFSKRRKTLRKILRDAKQETDLDLDLNRRPETLSVTEWGELANHLRPVSSGE